MVLPEISKEFHTGSNQGDSFSELAIDNSWQLPFNQKREMFGKDMARTVPLAVQTGEFSSAVDTASAAVQESLEPISFWSYDVKFYRDLLRGHCCKVVLDGTCLDSNVAEAALFERIGYIGVVKTEAAKLATEQRLQEVVLRLMRTTGSPHHNKRFALALQGQQGTQPKDDTPEKKRPRKAATPKSQPKEPAAKAAAKKTAKKKAEEEDKEDFAEEDYDVDEDWDPLADLGEEPEAGS